MKITAVNVENYQAIRNIEIRPGDRALVIVGGRNRQGKSSLLSALEVAFGGKAHAGPEPVRHGEKSARIAVTLDGAAGELVIERKITRDGAQRLEVRQAGEKQAKPQKLLDALIAARFLDPLKFLSASPRQQRELLIQVARIELDLDQVAADRAAAYQERTDVNRELKRRQAELDGLGPAEDVAGEPVDVAAAARELDELRGRQREQRERREEMSRCDDEIQQIDAEIERLQKRREQLQAKSSQLFSAMLEEDGDDELAAAIEDREQRIASAAAHNQAIARAQAAAERRGTLRAERNELQRKSDALTGRIESLDAAKAKALAAAEMPIPGLEVSDSGVVYNGAPFQQASDAEQLQAALAIAVALSPNVRDVWVRDGSLLDDDSLEAVRRFAQERDCRVWLERVGDGDEGAIVIEEGAVRVSQEVAGG